MTSESSTPITIADSVLSRLTDLIEARDEEDFSDLEAELARAEVVPDDELPGDVVSIGSRVTFVDQESGRRNTVVLVYPRDANMEEMKISVLSPAGSALIGLRVGGAIEWPLPGGRFRHYTVEAVEQPAA